MIFAALFAASLTFTATATGVEKGTPIEFFFAGRDSDRDYETMFLLDEPIAQLCKRLEQAGLPRGTSVDNLSCLLWPTGCRLKLSPQIDDFIESTLPAALHKADWIYTGGARDGKGALEAANDATHAFLSFYTLAQSPIVMNGIYNQGDVYGCYKAKECLKKGDKRTFTLTWNDQDVPERLSLFFSHDTAAEQFLRLKKISETNEVVVLARFDPKMTVAEAHQIANAISIIDSARVKFNGCSQGELFYRAFLPPISWLDRTNRLTQPFELTVGQSDELVYINEDWSVEGNDPKLTAQTISFSVATNYPKTNTCFLYASGNEKLERLFVAMKKLNRASIQNWYVFERQ